MWEEPSNGSGGEPKDLVGFEDAIGFVVELGGGLTVESGVWNWGAGNLVCEEEGVVVLGVSGREPGKVVTGPWDGRMYACSCTEISSGTGQGLLTDDCLLLLLG